MKSPIRALIALGVVGMALSFARPANAAHCKDDDDSPEEICRERDIFLMPGVVGVAFLPAAESDPFFGAGVQLSPLIWSHNNDRFGPGQGVVFVQASLLGSQSSSATMGLFEGGTSLSLEKNSSRRFGIPFFGFSVGGLVHEELPNSSFTHAFLGAHLYFHHNLIFDLQGGYHFPFQDLDVLRGPRGQMTLRFSGW